MSTRLRRSFEFCENRNGSGSLEHRGELAMILTCDQLGTAQPRLGLERKRSLLWLIKM